MEEKDHAGDQVLDHPSEDFQLYMGLIYGQPSTTASLKQ